MPVLPDDLFNYFDTIGVRVTTISHPPVFTVEEAKRLRGEIVGGHTKNLFLKDKKGRVFLVVAIEDTPVDLKRLHTRIESQRLSFGKPDLLMQLMGVVPGAVTPFGVLNDENAVVSVVLDANLMRHEMLNFHPLDNSMTTSIGRDDLLAFLRATGHEPRILDLSAGVSAE